MHADFLAAIAAEPDDLTHRLVYADWLEENGASPLDAARAELIRVQIAREAADEDGDDYWHLRARERALLGGWHAELAGDLAARVSRYRFRRGFVEWVLLDAAAVEERADALARGTPLRAVALNGPGFAGVPPTWHGLDALDLRRAESLAGVPGDELPSLRRLDLNPLGTELWLARRTDRPLEHLGVWSEDATGNANLRAQRATAELYRALFAGPPPAGLRSLACAGGVAANGWEAAFESPWLAGVEALHVPNHLGTGPPTAVRLSRHRDAAGLRSLTLVRGNSEWTEPPGPMLRSLRRLHLSGCGRLGPVAAANLRELGCGELRAFILTNVVEATDDGPLLQSWHLWPGLAALMLRNVDRRLAEQVLAGPYPAQLRALEMPHLPEGGFPPSLGPLPLVELRFNGGVPTSVRDVVRSALPHLASLEIGHAKLDDPDDLAPLLDRGRFPRLCWLGLGGVRVPEPWQSRLRERLGRGFRISPRPTRSPGHDLVHEVRTCTPTS